MFEYPCPLLEAFFAIPESEINDDLERSTKGVGHIRWELSHLMAQVLDQPPTHSARISHLLIVQAYAMSRHPHVPLEIKACYARMTAGLLGVEAEDSAWSSPRGKGISRQIDEIEQREGLTGEAGEQGPPEYHHLSDELGEILQEAYDRTFLRALRRYHMDELAALYESQPDKFILLADIGSRALHTLRQMPRIIAEEDRRILEQHGPAALERVRERVEELREQVSDIEGPWPIPKGLS